MAKGDKATAQPGQQESAGEHGGNRGGDHDQERKPPKQSSQSAGKDPHRGKGD